MRSTYQSSSRGRSISPEKWAKLLNHFMTRSHLRLKKRIDAVWSCTHGSTRFACACQEQSPNWRPTTSAARIRNVYASMARNAGSIRATEPRRSIRLPSLSTLSAVTTSTACTLTTTFIRTKRRMRAAISSTFPTKEIGSSTWLAAEA